MVTPTEVSDRNLAFITMNCAVPQILTIRVGKKVRTEKKCLALISRVSLYKHFLGMSLILKHWRVAFIMRKKFPHSPNISAYVPVIWVLGNKILFFKGKEVPVIVSMLRKMLNLLLV